MARPHPRHLARPLVAGRRTSPMKDNCGDASASRASFRMTNSEPEAERVSSPAHHPSRVVHHGDGLAWLERTALPVDHAIVTSLPDSSEVGHLSFDAWR